MHEHKPTTHETQPGDASTPQAPLIRLRSAGDLVATIPALFGFHPHQSLVAVLLNEQSRIACSMRVDLDDALNDDFDILGRVTDAARTADADTVVVLLFATRGDGGLPWADAVSNVVTVLQRDELMVRDALLVDRGRYWSFLCQEQTCCPLEGTPVPAGTTQLEAHRVVQGGHAVVADRDAVMARYRARPDLAPDAGIYDAERPVLALPLAQRCQQALGDVRALRAAWCSQGERPTQELTGDELRARLGLLLTDVTVRDYLLGTLATEQPDLTEATQVLTWLALTSTDELRPALAATAAVLVALGGDDPAAAWALIALAEGQSLARLLAEALQVFAPQTLRDLFTEALPLVQARIDAA